MDPLNAPFSSEAMSVFLESLVIMFKGMFGIFVFMLIFYCLVKALERIFKNDAEKE